jgi:hypothetical protein
MVAPSMVIVWMVVLWMVVLGWSSAAQEVHQRSVDLAGVGPGDDVRAG